jgi:hypothetical protein
MAARRKGKYTPNPRRSREILAAIDAGVMAAAERYQKAVIDYWVLEVGYGENGELGYTAEGRYATGAASNVEVSTVVTRRGKRVADVYSAANRSGEPYPVFWELGHNNEVTMGWEEQPIFGPALLYYQDDIVGVMARRIRASFKTVGISKKINPKSGMIRVSEP